MDERNGHDTPQEQGNNPDFQPLDPRLLRRLFIAFIVIVIIALASAIILPRAGLSIPWYVFALTFLAILAAAMAPLFEGRAEPDDDDAPAPAGRIGPNGREHIRREDINRDNST